MMWLMMLFCAFPLVILLFGKDAVGEYGWFAILVIGALVIGHFWLMRKGHNNNSSSEDQKNADSRTHERNKHSCH